MLKKYWLEILIVIVFILLLLSCSPGRRISRICKNNPDVCKTDTITKIVTDTFTVKQVSVDTVFTANTTDTVYLTKDNFIIKYKYNPITKTVYLSGLQKEQKHIFEHKIQVINNEVKIKKHWSDQLWLVISIIGGLVLITSLIKKR